MDVVVVRARNQMNWDVQDLLELGIRQVSLVWVVAGRVVAGKVQSVHTENSLKMRIGSSECSDDRFVAKKALKEDVEGLHKGDFDEEFRAHSCAWEVADLDAVQEEGHDIDQEDLAC